MIRGCLGAKTEDWALEWQWQKEGGEQEGQLRENIAKDQKKKKKKEKTLTK